MKMLSLHGYSFRKMGHFKLTSHRSKVEIGPPTENIHRIKDDHANSKIGYSHGTIARKEKHVRKSFYKGLLNSAYLWRRVRLAINKTQKYFLLPDHQLLLNSNFWFLLKDKKRIKANLQLNLKELELFSYKNVSQVLCKILATHYFFIDHFKHKTTNKKTCRMPSANSHQLCPH